MLQQKIKAIFTDSRNLFGRFSFTISDDPSKSLRIASKNTPNQKGLYFVFGEMAGFIHLDFEIEKKNYQLLYFGKAGQKKDGTLVRQGLRNRINNVVSDSQRKLKDVKRAIYWQKIMHELRINHLLVVWAQTESNCYFA